MDDFPGLVTWVGDFVGLLDLEGRCVTPLLVLKAGSYHVGHG
jgi:hypothetical protein